MVPFPGRTCGGSRLSGCVGDENQYCFVRSVIGRKHRATNINFRTISMYLPLETQTRCNTLEGYRWKGGATSDVEGNPEVCDLGEAERRQWLACQVLLRGWGRGGPGISVVLRRGAQMSIIGDLGQGHGSVMAEGGGSREVRSEGSGRTGLCCEGKQKRAWFWNP